MSFCCYILGLSAFPDKQSITEWYQSQVPNLELEGSQLIYWNKKIIYINNKINFKSCTIRNYVGML